MRFVAVKARRSKRYLLCTGYVAVNSEADGVNEPDKWFARGLRNYCGARRSRLRRAVAEILGDHNESVGEILRDALAEMSERLRSFAYG